ncbi:MAG: hypothetical protein PHT03_06495 [Bacilli bacterium]|nr:hypothetical protein [Bacilli bacterium]
MAKEKKRSVDEKEKEETLFYYELVGVICIIIAITILGRLGKIGFFLAVFFKVLFGDWYWIFIVFLLFYGFVSLLRHKSFNFKNPRFIGCVFVCFSLLIFAHFPIHNLIQGKSRDYFSETWALYRLYINTNSEMYLGGGMLGAVMFYIVYYMIGTIGVVMAGAFILMLGFSLIIDMPIVDIFKNFGRRVKDVSRLGKSFSRFFKYDIGRRGQTPEKKNIFSKSQQLPLKILEEYQNVMNYNFQEKLAYETRSLIHSVYNNLHIEYRDLDLTVSYKVTTYKFTVFTDFDATKLVERLNNVIEEDILIAQDGSNLMLQIVNKYPQILTMRELLMKQSSLHNNYILPLGLTYENKLCELDVSQNGHLLLIGSEKAGIRNFINYYIFALFVKENLSIYEMEIYDPKKELFILHDIIPTRTDEDVNEYLNGVVAEIDEKLETINQGGVSSLDEFNKKLDIENSSALRMKRKFIIINRLDCDKETYSYFENKLMYIIQLGEKAGITVVYVLRDVLYVTSIILSLFANKLVFKVDNNFFSQKIINNDNATFLQAAGDCFFLSQIKARRIQTALVSKKDIETIKNHLK